MPMRWQNIGIVIGVMCSLLGCRSPYYADRGAVVGGLTGAGIGAAIGEATNGKGGAGAIIGGALGAMTGTMVGKSLDEINARNQQLIQQKMGRNLVGAMTIDDAIAMSQAGLSDDVVINYLRGNGLTGQLTPSELIRLKQSEVSDPVIAAMQQIGQSVRTASALPARPAVVVQEYYHDYHPPWHHPRWRYQYHHGWPRRHSEASWEFSFGN